MDKVIATLGELKDEATRFVNSLKPGNDSATLIALMGELGAGKTAFTKAVAEALGVVEIVASPTFVLEKRYELPPHKAFKSLVHIDAYRLERGSDLGPLHFTELMQDPGNLVMVEWPERVHDSLPAPAIKISFSVHTNGTRTLSYG